MCRALTALLADPALSQGALVIEPTLADKCRALTADNQRFNNIFGRTPSLIASYVMPEPLQAHLKETVARLRIEARCVGTRFHGRFHMEPLT